jgi:tetratricopeptide (TPR) repeat protein
MTTAGLDDWEAGNRLYVDGQFEKALECYNRAVVAGPDNPDYRFNRGVTLFRLNQLHHAVDDLHYVLEIQPEDPAAWYVLGEIRAEMGERALALKNFRAALARNTDYGPARKAIVRLTSEEPTPELRPAARYHIRPISFASLAATREEEADRKTLRVPTLSDVLHVTNDETPVVALERTLRSVERETDLDGTVKKAVLLSALHRREAGACWERVLQTRGSDPEVLRRAVRAYFESADWDDVCRLSATAGDGAPEDVRRRNAVALIALGRPSEAIASLCSVEEPTAESLRVLAGAYLALDQRARALECAAQARTLAPASAILKSLEEIASGSWFSSPRPLDHLSGLDGPKAVIRERVVLPLLVPELYLTGPSINKFLMMGPPGCGKTTLARVASAEAHARFETLHLTSILNLFTGNTEANLTAFFKEAKDLTEESPVVVMIDEVDAIAIARETMTQDSERRLVNHFMSELDAIRQFPNLVVLAATNSPFDMDSAVLRSGRLGTPLYVGPPDELAREQLLERQLNTVTHDTVDVKAVAQRLEWYSPADIEQVFSTLRFRARRLRLSGQQANVSTEELLDEFGRVSPSVKIWFHRVALRIQEDPYVEGLLGVALKSDLDRFLRSGKEDEDISKPKSTMYR